MTAPLSRHYSLALLGALVAGPLMGQNQFAAFPGSPSLRSPDGNYQVACREPRGPEQRHHLLLRNLATNRVEDLLGFDRHVDVLWSPDGGSLLVNDYFASDASTCFVITIGAKSVQRVDLREKLKTTEMFGRKLLGNHHVYVRGVDWLDARTVLIKSDGYGDLDPDGFTEWFRYRPGQPAQQLTFCEKGNGSP